MKTEIKKILYKFLQDGIASDDAAQQVLDLFDVGGSLPDIYSGELNTERIKQYKHLAEGYNVSESTVRDIFCNGAEWYKHILSNKSKTK